MRRRVGALLALLALLPVRGLAQASDAPLAGRWSVTWAQAVRVNPDGSLEIQRWGDAELILHVEGERVTGEWITSLRDRVTWRVEGSWEDGRLHLTATEHDSDNPELAAVESMEWEARVEAGRMEGTVWLHFRGVRSGRAAPPRPFRATRGDAGGMMRRSRG